MVSSPPTMALRTSSFTTPLSRLTVSAACRRTSGLTSPPARAPRGRRPSRSVRSNQAAKPARAGSPIMAAEGAASWMVAVWDLVAQQAAGRQARVSVQDVCAAAVAAIQVSGAGVLAVSRAGAVHVIWATDQVSKQLADIELTVGEGPRADASAFGGPVLASDLGHDDIVGRWPAFAPAAQAAGAAAIFAFPLQIGAIRVGVLEMYRRLPSPLSTLALGDALLFADTATLLLLEG